MTPKAYRAAVEALNGIALKVFEAVPINADWSLHQIVGEIARTGSKPDYKVVQGCLTALVEKGLARCPKEGVWRRVTPRESAPPPPPEEVRERGVTEAVAPPMPAAANTPAPAPTPLDRLSAVSSRLAKVAEAVRSIADEVEQIALDIEERDERHAKELATLRQLQSLLKTLGTEGAAA